jgi:hypothetical protein
MEWICASLNRQPDREGYWARYNFLGGLGGRAGAPTNQRQRQKEGTKAMKSASLPLFSVRADRNHRQLLSRCLLFEAGGRGTSTAGRCKSREFRQSKSFSAQKREIFGVFYF